MATTDAKAIKTDWTAEEDHGEALMSPSESNTGLTLAEELPQLPAPTEVTGADGITVITTWKYNDDQKRTKVGLAQDHYERMG
jgi:hypothetical protein